MSAKRLTCAAEEAEYRADAERDNYESRNVSHEEEYRAIGALLRAAAADPNAHKMVESALVSYAGNDHYLLVRSGEMARAAAEAVDLALGQHIDKVAAVLLADVEDKEPSS